MMGPRRERPRPGLPGWRVVPSPPPPYLHPMPAPLARPAPPAPDRATLHTWLHHWQDEFDAAYLYLVLAGQEPDQKKKEIYIKLAGVEERHTQMWQKLLAEHRHPITTERAPPSLNPRLRAGVGRRFGPRYLLPLLLRGGGQE